MGKVTVPPWERCPLVVAIFLKLFLTSEGVNPYMLIMKLSELITERLLLVGVERPAARLVEEIEKLIIGRVRSAVFGVVTPRLVARAFAATLTPETGVSGTRGTVSLNKQCFGRPGPQHVACQSPDTTQNTL